MKKNVKQSLIAISIWKTLFFLALLAVLIRPYIVSHLAHEAIGRELSLSPICQEGGVVRVLEYYKIKRSATLYCLYSDARSNTRLQVEKTTGGWKVVFSEIVGRGVYWPFYL